MKTTKGFTIAEILVVIAIVAIVGTIMVAIFTSTLRGTNKSQIFSVIKQNGQAVLEEMDKTIRGAENVVCPFLIAPATSATSINLVVMSRGIYTRYRFIAPTSGSNGYIQKDMPTKQINDTGVLETDSQFVDRVCIDTSPMDGASVLTDTNISSGVSIEGFFTRMKQIGFKDIVSVEFSIRPGIAANSAIAGQIDPVAFQTTIQLR